MIQKFKNSEERKQNPFSFKKKDDKNDFDKEIKELEIDSDLAERDVDRLDRLVKKVFGKSTSPCGCFSSVKIEMKSKPWWF